MTKIPSIPETELRNNKHLRGVLGRTNIQSVEGKPSELVLTIHVGAFGGEHNHHIFLTEAVQLLELASHIQRTLLPKSEILEALERIEQKLEG